MLPHLQKFVEVYTRDGDQDKLEKATKGLILRKNLVREEIAEEKNKEIDEIIIEEDEGLDEAERLHMVRSVPKPTEFPMGTKLIDPKL